MTRKGKKYYIRFRQFSQSRLFMMVLIFCEKNASSTNILIVFFEITQKILQDPLTKLSIRSVGIVFKQILDLPYNVECQRTAQNCTKLQSYRK